MRRAVLLVSLLATGSFTWALNFTLLTPLLKPIARNFAVSDASVGQLATLQSAATGVTALLVTPWMDRFGRGKLLRFGAAMLVAGTAFTALAPGFAWLFPARLLAGIGAAFIMPVCLASAGDLFEDPRRRNQAVGMVIAATGLAGTIGLPILTQIADLANWRWAAGALLAPSLLIAVGSIWLPVRATATGMFDPRQYLRHYGHVLSSWQTNWLLAASLVRGIAWYSALIYLGAYAVTSYATDADQLSLLLATTGTVFFIATNVMPFATRVLSARRLFVLSLFVLFANFMTTGLVSETWSLFVFVLLLSIAGAGISVAESILLLDSFPSATGGVMALRSASNEVGAAVGSALMGILLVLFDDYSSAFRVLGLLLPLGVLALMISTRIRVSIPADPDTAPLSRAAK